MFYEVIIHPASGGFGQWDATRGDEGWADEQALLQAIYDQPASVEIYALDDDELPASVEDIRGRVRNEPAKILALVTTQHGEKTVRYVGIDEQLDDKEQERAAKKQAHASQ